LDANRGRKIYGFALLKGRLETDLLRRTDGRFV
jgi:hypothetical protein